MSDFEQRNQEMIERMAGDPKLGERALEFLTAANAYEYSYHFRWMGRPIIQYPQDILAVQEIIWDVKPELIIETGIARGGSLILSASILQLIGGNGRVVGVDVDIRQHNRKAIEEHPMFERISMIEGSSVDPEIAGQICRLAEGRKPVMVFLDSNHTHEHVLRELELYSPLVTKGSYLVVFDTIVENLPSNSFPNNAWDKGDNPMTAVREFLSSNPRFEIDRKMETKLQVTVAPSGYLKCIAD